MRRTGNSDETKRILMDLDVVLKSIDCRHIVVCLGCFITASDVWICMELMSTCFDKLLKHLKQPIPEQARQFSSAFCIILLLPVHMRHSSIPESVCPCACTEKKAVQYERPYQQEMSPFSQY